MTTLHVASGDRIVEPMIALAGCSARQRIIVVGSKSMELMFELRQRGYAHAFAAGNCGRPAAQYDVALVDWRRRSLHDLDATLDWLSRFLAPHSVVVVWVDAQKPAANLSLRACLESRGYVVEQGTVHACGCAVAARLRQAPPLRSAA